MGVIHLWELASLHPAAEVRTYLSPLLVSPLEHGRPPDGGVEEGAEEEKGMYTLMAMMLIMSMVSVMVMVMMMVMMMSMMRLRMMMV